MKLLSLFLILSLASCAKKVPVKAAVEYHDTFAFQQDGKDTIIVSVLGPQGEREAKEYLCAASYVCVREDLPVHVYRLTRVRK